MSRSGSDRWAEVDLGAIRHNLRHVAMLQPPGTDVIAVVKADAYGHGAVPVARAALRAGAWGLAVSTLEEARELLAAEVGERDRLVALGGLLPEHAVEAVELGSAVTCHRADLAAALAEAAGRGNAVLPVHLKVDTGMGRLGCAPEEAVDIARRIVAAPGLRLAGTFTHFAASESDEAMTRHQARVFASVLDELVADGIDPGLRHAGNSGGALRHPDLALDAVRVGIALYGYDPGGLLGGLDPALTLRARVTHVKTVPEGATIGYGATWRAPRPSRIATASIGYADGVMRARSSRGDVLVRGRRVPLVGRVSMDAITLDVTSAEGVAVGDVVTLIGTDGDQRITAEEVAAWSDTISYEVLTAIGPRVERRYPE